MHSGPFGCLTKLGAKRAELVQKFVPEVASDFFKTNAPDPTHWTLNRHFVAFRIIWVHSGPFGCLTKLSAKQAELVQSSCHEVASEFFATYAPDPPYWTQTDVLVYFVLLGYIRDSLVALRNSVHNGPNLCKSSCHEIASEFFATNTPDLPHWTLN